MRPPVRSGDTRPAGRTGAASAGAGPRGWRRPRSRRPARGPVPSWCRLIPRLPRPCGGSGRRAGRCSVAGRVRSQRLGGLRAEGRGARPPRRWPAGRPWTVAAGDAPAAHARKVRPLDVPAGTLSVTLPPPGHGHLDLRAERGLSERHRHGSVTLSPARPKTGCARDMDHDEGRRPDRRTRPRALAVQPDPLAVLHPGRDAGLHRAAARPARPRAVAGTGRRRSGRGHGSRGRPRGARSRPGCAGPARRRRTGADARRGAGRRTGAGAGDGGLLGAQPQREGHPSSASSNESVTSLSTSAPRRAGRGGRAAGLRRG